LNNNVFNENELTAIREVFLAGVDGHFFEFNHDKGQFQPTSLYQKFIKEFDLPSIFECKTKIAKTPEQQWIDKVDLRWNINYNTSSAFRNEFEDYLDKFENGSFYKGLGDANSNHNVKIVSSVRLLIAEEIYNPFFKAELAKISGGEKNYLLLNALKSENDIENLYELSAKTKELYQFLTRKPLNEFLIRCRKVLQAEPYIEGSY